MLRETSARLFPFSEWKSLRELRQLTHSLALSPHPHPRRLAHCRLSYLPLAASAIHRRDAAIAPSAAAATAAVARLDCQTETKIKCWLACKEPRPLPLPLHRRIRHDATSMPRCTWTFACCGWGHATDERSCRAASRCCSCGAANAMRQKLIPLAIAAAARACNVTVQERERESAWQKTLQTHSKTRSATLTFRRLSPR